MTSRFLRVMHNTPECQKSIRVPSLDLEILVVGLAKFLIFDLIFWL